MQGGVQFLIFLFTRWKNILYTEVKEPFGWCPDIQRYFHAPQKCTHREIWLLSITFWSLLEHSILQVTFHDFLSLSLRAVCACAGLCERVVSVLYWCGGVIHSMWEGSLARLQVILHIGLCAQPWSHTGNGCNCHGKTPGIYKVKIPPSQLWDNHGVLTAPLPTQTSFPVVQNAILFNSVK